MSWQSTDRVSITAAVAVVHGWSASSYSSPTEHLATTSIRRGLPLETHLFLWETR